MKALKLNASETILVKKLITAHRIVTEKIALDGVSMSNFTEEEVQRCNEEYMHAGSILYKIVNLED